MTSEIDRLTERIENEPPDAWFYWERGWLYSKPKQWKLAIEDFSKAIVLAPDEPVFWRDRGWFYELLGHITFSRNDLTAPSSWTPRMRIPTPRGVGVGG